MKLYFTPGTCSFAPHIVARELGLDVELHRVRLGAEPLVVAENRDFRELNPLGYVPVLELDDGRVLSEGVAILLHLADAHPEAGLAPAAGTPGRDELQRWLTFTNSELHKTFSPWLFHPEYGEQAASVARERLAKRFAVVDRHLTGRDYLLGTQFTVADAYLFTIADWARVLKLPMEAFPTLLDYQERMHGRNSVADALKREKAA